MARNSGRFHFDGGAGTYVGTGILAFLVILFSLGFATPFAVVLRQRWRTKHTYIDGQRLMFTGTGMSLFGNFIKWWLLCIVTLGIYAFWVVPRMTKWVVENTDFDPTWRPNTLPPVGGQQAQLPPQLPTAPASFAAAAEPRALEGAPVVERVPRKAASRRPSPAKNTSAAENQAAHKKAVPTKPPARPRKQPKSET